MAEMYRRTRQAFGSQIREALDDMVTTGKIKEWRTFQHATDSRTLYQVEGFIGNISHGKTPGEMAEWLNAQGYDVRFGKA